jgi:hypothetical protein
MGISFHGGHAGKPGRGLICRGLCVEEGSGRGVSPYRGPIGGPGEGVGQLGSVRMKGSLGMEHLS